MGPIFATPSAVVFILANGAIGAGLVYWALTQPNSPINAVVPLNETWQKALAIGLGVRIIVRSRILDPRKKSNNRRRYNL